MAGPRQRIVLVRHGRPRLDAPKRVAGRELGVWIERYDAAGIDPALPPPARVRALAEDVGTVVSSDLRRAVESAREIAPGREVPADRVFREAGLPRPRAGLRLDPQLWGFAARIAWFCGYSGDAESLVRARERARQGAARLEALCDSHGSAMLVAHGIVNGLIGRELRRAGWRGPRLVTGPYWSHAVFEPAPGSRTPGPIS